MGAGLGSVISDVIAKTGVAIRQFAIGLRENIGPVNFRKAAQIWIAVRVQKLIQTPTDRSVILRQRTFAGKLPCVAISQALIRSNPALTWSRLVVFPAAQARRRSAMGASTTLNTLSMVPNCPFVDACP